MSTREERFRLIDGAVARVVGSSSWSSDVAKARRSQGVKRSQKCDGVLGVNKNQAAQAVTRKRER